QERVMETEARRREFETRLARALEMSGDELAAYDIITRALKVAVPESPVELLLADNSHAHLQRAVSIAADADAAARCPVASPDGLTGLTDRRSLENRARILRGHGVDFALVMADLDHFKSLNDTHGHECGDRALRVFAETLRDGIRTDDVACRYGGEEFIVLLPGVDVHEAIEVMERVREALARNTRRGDVPAFTAS